MRPIYLEIEGLQSYKSLQKIDFEKLMENGLFGILTGGVTAMSAGLTAAMVLSLVCALIFRSKRIE